MLELVTLEPDFHRLFTLLSVHRVMLADELRVARFAAALRQAVRPGDLVIDVGTGTGLLAFLALQAGARHVIAIEATSVVEVAAEVARDNGWQDRITFIRANADEVSLSERADLVVSETIGHLGVAEQFLSTIIHGRSAFLRPGGALIPEEISVWVAPVDSPAAYAPVSSWDERVAGVSFSAARRFAATQAYICRFAAEQMLAPPTCLVTLPLAHLDSSVLTLRSRVTAARAGTLHGLCVWFDARLHRDVTLSTSPWAQPTHWQQAFLPLDATIDIDSGTVLDVSLNFDDHRNPQLTWAVSSRRPSRRTAGMP